jgi:hypothetical protein
VQQNATSVTATPAKITTTDTTAAVAAGDSPASPDASPDSPGLAERLIDRDAVPTGVSLWVLVGGGGAALAGAVLVGLGEKDATRLAD